MLMRAFQNQSANLKRGLGLLLLIFIVYGTTVEAAHRHGRVTQAGHNAAAAFDKTGSTSTTPITQPGCSDCLICQLHQNFSATLISVKPLTEPLVRHTDTPQLDPVSIRSIAHSPQSGRAPPQAN
jgi:Protein of unknown function (DUF2946)